LNLFINHFRSSNIFLVSWKTLVFFNYHSKVANKQFTEEELKERLTSEQYEVTQNAGTERAFSGVYWNEKADGMYCCIVCDAKLFSSDTKFESGSGWPSFTEPVDEKIVESKTDTSHGMTRTEVLCTECGAHLGHVFPDGPGSTGDRFCINSASLKLEETD